MKPCSTDDTPPRATCKKTFYICINNLIFVIASSKKKEACKTISATGLEKEKKMCVKESQNHYIFLYLKCNRRYVTFSSRRWSYGVLLYEIFTIGKVL